uniref:Uncharacterized protein n=1 Tax=virus sp. ctReX5 TaxID=2825818 RepID=A0A8S5RKV0_9VIRU|nr:MAG TPA: hypothetical protein [virus sp. ctReX5]
MVPVVWLVALRQAFLFCSLPFDLTIQYYIARNMSIPYCNKN